MSDPNSRHQLWSKWTVTIRPTALGSPTFETVRVNTARFMRKAFGSSAHMRVRQFTRSWVIEVLADSQRHPHDALHDAAQLVHR